MGDVERSYLQEVVLPYGAENVLYHAFGAGAEQITELRGVRLWEQVGLFHAPVSQHHLYKKYMLNTNNFGNIYWLVEPVQHNISK